MRAVEVIAAVSLAACAGAHLSGARAALLSPCLAPDGAVPDDGVDDREAIQATLDKAAALATETRPVCVQLEPGGYQITRRSEPGAAAIASLQIRDAVHLQGAGAEVTRIEMRGSAKLADKPADWVLISLTGVRGAVRDLTLDGQGRHDTGEQTHLIQVNGPAKQTVIERIETNLPYLGDSAGGDCIRLLGASGAPVQGVTIRNVTATACDRSWLGIQRGVHNLVVENSRTLNVGDQAIDIEPTGSKAFLCAPITSNLVFRGLDLARGKSAQGPYTVALTGEGCAHTHYVKFLDSVVRDGGIFVHKVEHLTIRNVTLQ